MNNLLQIRDNFLQELVEASEGRASSLPFLKFELNDTKYLQENELFDVLVIGGSVYEHALARKSEKKVALESKTNGELPLFSNKQMFFEFMEGLISPETTVLCINFAGPLEVAYRDGKPDGVLITATKEHIFDGLIGRMIGSEFENYILNKQNRKIDVFIANDTVCLLLAGLGIGNYDNMVGLVIGTGYNSAFFLNEKILVNLEAAEFTKFQISESTKWINDNSQNPGRYVFEKEVSGGYLYKHFNYILKQKGIVAGEIVSTKDLSDLAASNEKSEQSEIARNLLKHSAQMIASQIAGIAEFKKRDLIIIAEGSLFWKGYGYKAVVEQTLNELTSYTIEFKYIENSSLVGAGQLVQ